MQRMVAFVWGAAVCNLDGLVHSAAWLRSRTKLAVRSAFAAMQRLLSAEGS